MCVCLLKDLLSSNQYKLSAYIEVYTWVVVKQFLHRMALVPHSASASGQAPDM